MSNNLERLIRKIVKEAPMDFGDYQERPDPKTQRRIEDPQGIYAKNRAFRGGVSDVEKMTSKRFKEIVDYVKRYFGTQQNITNPQVKLAIQREQMRAVQQAMRTEPRYREQLRDLAVEIAAKEDGFLSFDLTMEDAINQGIIAKKRRNGGGIIYEFDFVNVLTFLGEQPINPNEFQIKPEEKKKLELPKNFSFDIDELTPEEQRELEIEKRNVINAMVQGAGKRGQFAYQAYKDRLDAIDPSLYELYNKIMGANDLMYFTDEDLIEALGGNAAGSAGKGGDAPNDDDDDEEQGGEQEDEGNGNDMYTSNGLIFPILLHELSKMFPMVQTREQWRGMDPEMAMDVMGQTDTMQNEPMNFRVGAELIRKMRMLLPDDLTLNNEGKIYTPFFYKILYGIPAEEFLKDVIANVVSDNPSDNEKAKRRFNDILGQAKEMYRKTYGDDEDDDYDDDDDDDGVY
jgi:hypothetical protein